MSNKVTQILFSRGLQPVITIVLLVGFIVLGSQYFFSQNNRELDQVTELTQKVTFDDAVKKIENSSYEVYTRGSLYIPEGTSISDLQDGVPKSQTTPTPSVTTITLVENKYDDLFFTLEKNKVQKIDIRSLNTDASLLINKKGEIVYIDNVKRTYTLYKNPADDEKNAIQLFTGMRNLFSDQIFPFTSLIEDYRAKKYNPVERAYNIYSGKWQHPVYTNGRVVDTIVETDPTNGLFRSIAFTSTNPPSIIYFDFRNIDSTEGYDSIPDNYQSVPVPNPYKTKD